MLSKKIYLLIVLVALFVLVSADSVAAQTSRRRSRRPVTTQPATPTTEPQIISTADDEQEPTPRATTRSRVSGSTASKGTGRTAGADTSRSREDAEQRALANLELLSQAEARAERLRAQLFAAQDRETELQDRLREIEFELQPENIDRINNLNGSTRPELVREKRRRSLETDKARVTSQLAQASLSRTRLDGAVASADALVDKLRRTVDADAAGLNQPATDAGEPADRETAPPTAPAGNGYEPPTDDEDVPSDRELVRLIKASLADAGITTVQVEAANGAVILTGDVTSRQVPAALQAAYDARPRKIYNQMTVK